MCATQLSRNGTPERFTRRGSQCDYLLEMENGDQRILDKSDALTPDTKPSMGEESGEQNETNLAQPSFSTGEWAIVKPKRGKEIDKTSRQHPGRTADG
ncbi:hypothetical protein HYE67_009964 [Fusarium culmorum]|uniref:Uncharacterized protein n=1 Tax=Fusarium culmorum TaxID=5516 RepID=A0A2T4H9S2_FUSCU|nr:hypothetical protein FCULG_00004905 [Fusarium culmorum]QPC67733.1 hypothetical protein HYE67_009964 [Fusarium culmorum]